VQLLVDVPVAILQKLYLFPMITTYLTHDYLLSAAATPGKQSFQKKQQRLPKRQQLRVVLDKFMQLSNERLFYLAKN